MRRINSDFRTKFISEEGQKLSNRDYFGYVEMDDFACYVLADSLDGETRSNSAQFVVESLIRSFGENPTLRKGKLKKYIQNAHRELRKMRGGMHLKASVVLAVTDYKKLRYCYVGNSRLYLLRNSRFLIQTKDQSLTRNLIDDRKIPLDQAAQKFELFCHVIYGDATRIDNFTSLYRNVGFDDQPVLLFSGMADLYGIISPEEREHGVLAVDMGRGTTEYIAIFNDGVFASGVVPVGFDHVANDLAIGLGLPIETTRDLLVSNTIPQAVTSGSGIIQIKQGSQSRRIPLASFEKIIDLRLRELFTIIKNSFEDRNVLRNLARGGVITGGGALFPRTAEIFQQTFDQLISLIFFIFLFRVLFIILTGKFFVSGFRNLSFRFNFLLTAELFFYKMEFFLDSVFLEG